MVKRGRTLMVWCFNYLFVGVNNCLCSTSFVRFLYVLMRKDWKFCFCVYLFCVNNGGFLASYNIFFVLVWWELLGC